MEPATVVWWARRDLRLTENTALADAALAGARVVPLFVVDPRLVHGSRAGEKRVAFLFDALRSLAKGIEAHGGQLVVREGDPAIEVAEVAEAVGASKVVAEGDVSWFARRRDARVAARVRLDLVGGPWLCGPGEVLKKDRSPYTVFTPYLRVWREVARSKLSEKPAGDEVRFGKGPSSASLEGRPGQAVDAPYPASEVEAQRRLEQFINERVDTYDTRRDRMDLDGTSTLSPYLRFGLLGVRSAARMAMAVGGEGATAWLAELAWRDFYLGVLAHFPHVARGSFRREYDNVHWDNDASLFEAWCAGQTGYPVVDAAMRQLAATGWMHNRARMIVASFLTKDLLIDWRWGEGWFALHLVDGDPAANNGGWQWTAGTGTDAAPYFRVFNPVSQGLRFDPHGDYVRRWVPELRGIDGGAVHEPWLIEGGVPGYPERVVDHGVARMRAVEAYRAARRAD